MLSLHLFMILDCIDKGISSTIPAGTLIFSTKIYLYLSVNNLSWELSPELARVKLMSLTNLILDINDFSSTIPSSLASLTNLDVMCLFGNNLIGFVLFYPILPMFQHWNPMKLMKTMTLLCDDQHGYRYQNTSPHSKLSIKSHNIKISWSKYICILQRAYFYNTFFSVFPRSLLPLPFPFPFSIHLNRSAPPIIFRGFCADS